MIHKCRYCEKIIRGAYYIHKELGFDCVVCQECRYQDKTKRIYEYYILTIDEQREVYKGVV